MEDLDALRIRKGDFLIGVNAKDQSRATDVRKFEQEKLDELLSNAMRGKYLILRIVKRDHEDYEKFLQIQRVSHVIFLLRDVVRGNRFFSFFGNFFPFISITQVFL